MRVTVAEFLERTAQPSLPSATNLPQSTTPANPERNRGIFRALCIYLIAIFLWRALTTADEFPSRGLQVLTIALDLLCLMD